MLKRSGDNHRQTYANLEEINGFLQAYVATPDVVAQHGKVDLSQENVQSIVDTLMYDGSVEDFKAPLEQVGGRSDSSLAASVFFFNVIAACPACRSHAVQVRTTECLDFVEFARSDASRGTHSRAVWHLPGATTAQLREYLHWTQVFDKCSDEGDVTPRNCPYLAQWFSW